MIPKLCESKQNRNWLFFFDYPKEQLRNKGKSKRRGREVITLREYTYCSSKKYCEKGERKTGERHH